MLKHIVLVRLADRSPESVHKARDVLLSMRGRVPQLLHIEVGVNVAASERAYDLALVTHFDSAEALQAYHADPYHVDVVLPYMLSVQTAVAIVDYEA